MDMTVVTREHANIAVIDTFPSEGNKAPTMALTAQTTTSTADLMTWHCHLGHLNADAGAVLIGWGGGTRGCILGGPEEGKKEKLVGGL